MLRHPLADDAVEDHVLVDHLEVLWREINALGGRHRFLVAVKRPTAHQWNAESSEVVRAYRMPARVGKLAGLGHGSAVHVDAHRGGIPSKWQARDRGCGLDRWQGTHRFDDALKEGGNAARVMLPLGHRRWRNLECKNPLGPDSGGNLQEPLHAAHHQAGGNEQHQRHRHLTDHEQIAEANPPKPRAHAAAHVLERIVGIRVGQTPCGGEAEPNTG